MDRLPKNESLRVEFKSDLKCLPDNDIVDTVVGFANTEGGMLYLGVEDDGRVTGLHPNHSDVLKMTIMVANKTRPSLPVRAEIAEADGSPVLLIEVPKAQSIIATSAGKVMKRRLLVNGAPETVPMFPYEYNSRLADLGKLDFSSQALPETSVTNDFDVAEVERLKHIIATRGGEKPLLELTEEDLFKALGMVTEIGGTTYPTVTGLLLVGKQGSLAKNLPTAQAAFQVIQGTEVRVNELSHRPLIATFEFFEQMLKPWNPEREMEMGLFRIPIPEFDHRAFREALINAFCHRDYSVLQMTRVLVDDEGLTISNPGAFISGITLKTLITADPHGRNPLLADALKRIGLAERTGRGIDRIFEGSILYGRSLPDYSLSNEDSVTVFIPRSLPDIPFCRMLREEQSKLPQPFSINQLLILSALRTNKKLTVSELTEVTCIPEAKVKASLEKLIEWGLMDETGTSRNKNYLLSARIYKATGQSVAYVRQTKIDNVKNPELVHKLIETQGYVTIGDVQELLGLNRIQAQYLIRKMMKANMIVKEGNTRSAKYVLVGD